MGWCTALHVSKPYSLEAMPTMYWRTQRVSQIQAALFFREFTIQTL